MRHLKRVLGVLAVSLIVAHSAKAELFSIVVGDKLFSNFSIEQCVDGGATAPSLNNIVLRGEEMPNNTIGLYFNAPWYVGAGQSLNAKISYTVSILPEYQDQYMVGSTLALTDYWAASSSAQITSKVHGSGPNHLLADLYVANNSYKTDHDNFGESVKSVRVDTVLSLHGVNNDAHIYEFYQSFAQIPEPASMGMLGAGSIFSLVLRKKNRKRRSNPSQDFDSLLLGYAENEVDLFEEGNLGYVYTGRERLKSPIF